MKKKREKPKPKRKVDYRLITLAFIFIFCAGAILIVNSLGFPYEAYTLRTIVALVAETIMLVTVAVIIKDKILRLGIVGWLIAIMIWRLYNFAGTIVARPSVVDVFFILFYVVIFYDIYRIIKKEGNGNAKNIKQWIWSAIILIIAISLPFYFMFVYTKTPSFNIIYIFLDIILISLATTLLAIRKSPSRLFGYFMYAMADSVLLWQILVGIYYIASWVEAIFLIAFYILTVGYIKDTNR